MSSAPQAHPIPASARRTAFRCAVIRCPAVRNRRSRPSSRGSDGALLRGTWVPSPPPGMAVYVNESHFHYLSAPHSTDGAAPCQERCVVKRRSGNEEEFAFGLPVLEIPVGVGGLRQRKRAVDAQTQHAGVNPGQHVTSPREQVFPRMAVMMQAGASQKEAPLT